ncbi:MAG: TonB-dependent receptor [Gammaproteobacteria bacterium]|nr:TonB-dependent receptor [Pseudomonadales bacterium]MCP5348120.1 TonB-dependent receptor [Pseudomonadales bacterium]
MKPDSKNCAKVIFATSLLSAGISISNIALAQAVAGPGAGAVEQIIITGTRREGMTVSGSPAPIQLISAEALKESAAPDLMNQIANQIPSYIAEQRGGDMAQQTLTASLRALSPNHTLVLVNGKRRHTTSNISTAGYGPADLAFIPSSAISNTEVLTDGAAALYGSDAIAGVINLITKQNYNGGSIDFRTSEYKDGGGFTTNLQGSYGFSNDAGYFNVAVELEDREPVSRAGLYGPALCVADEEACLAAIDAGQVSSSYRNYIKYDQGMLFTDTYPNINQIRNTGRYEREIAFLDAGFNLDDGTEIYAWGSFGNKTSTSFQNYRRPSQDGGFDSNGDGSIDADERAINKYAYGFFPKQRGSETDYSLAVGITGEMFGWDYDLGTVYGSNEMDVYTLDSMNFTLWNETGRSQEDFYDGTFSASQWTTNLGINRDFEVGLAGPLTLAAGLEYREDTYGIDQGEPASWYGAGASSFPGYGPTAAGDWARENTSFYVNAIFNPLDNWIVDLAARSEQFSDLDNESVYKLTTRYDFNDSFAMRFTASTGFRAPNLGESQYNTVAVGPTSATLRLAGSGAAVGEMGYPPLAPEKSENLSLGFVLTPIDNLTTTVDFYQIKLKDRVRGVSIAYARGQDDNPPSATYLATGEWNTLLPDPGDIDLDGVRDASYNPIVGEILASQGYIGRDENGLPNPNAMYGGSFDTTARANISVAFNNNLFDTKTTGVDWITTYNTDFDWVNIRWHLSANYNNTEVLSSVVSKAGIPALNDATIEGLENGEVKYRANLGATFRFDKLTVGIRQQFFGPSYDVSNTSRNGAQWAATQNDFEEIKSISTASTVFYKNEYDAMSLTNVELSYRFNDMFNFTLGGDNIFNQYPNKVERSLYDYNAGRYVYDSGIYKIGHPIGYFGARWYAKMSAEF